MFFAVFDGHGGQGCSEYLRDNLHNQIASAPSFPHDLEAALREGCATSEKKFMQQNLEIVRDKSGSCAIICLITDTHCYVANVGDSRAIASLNFGKII